MIVSKRDAEAVANGRKTQLRLPQARVAPAEGEMLRLTYRRSNPDLGFRKDGSPKLEPVTACFALVQAVGPGVLEEIDPADAKAEGYRTPYEFVRAWKAEWAPRPSKRTPVWVLYLELDRTHRPRFMSRGVVAGRVGDYVTNPARSLRGEGEALSELELQELTRLCRDRDRQREESRRRDLEELPLEDRLKAYEIEARRRHVSIRSELRLIARKRDDAEVVERQVSRIRRRLGLEPLSRAA